MRILVTGAAGNIGRAVVARLHAAGAAVTALDLTPPPLPADRVVIGSAGDPAAVADALSEGADAVIHLAAIPSPLDDPALDVFTTNTRATFVVLEAAAHHGVPRAVIASSYSILGLRFSPHVLHPAYYPIDEQTPLQVEDAYALSKLTDENTAAMMHRHHGLTVVALRFPFTGDSDRIATMAAATREDPAVMAADSWSYLHVDDAAEAAWLAATRPLTGFHAVFLSAAETLAPSPTEDLIRTHHPNTPIRTPIPDRHTPINTTAIETLLNFHPTR